MKFFIGFLLLAFCTINVFAQSAEQSKGPSELSKVLIREAKRDSLLREFSIKQQNILAEQEVTNNIVSKSFDGVSMQLTGASHTLAVVGILFGILALGIGAYISYAQYQVSSIYSKNKLVLNEAKQIKQEVKDLNDLIKSYVPKLYQQIKREEALNILERLSTTPENIVNYSLFLLPEYLKKEDFKVFLNAFNRLSKTSNDNSTLHEMEVEYCVLLAQNFTYESLIEDSFKEKFLDVLWQVMRRFYIMDVKLSFEGFGRYIKVRSIERVGKEIEIYFYAIERVINQPNFEVYNSLIAILDKPERFALLRVFETKKDKLPKVYAAYKLCLDEVEKGLSSL